MLRSIVCDAGGVLVAAGALEGTIPAGLEILTLVADTLERAGLNAVDALDPLDSWSALLLAEKLDLALFTASDEVISTKIEIIRPW